MADKMPAGVKKRMAETPRVVPEDKLDKIRDVAEKARALQMEQEELETRLLSVKGSLHDYLTNTLPEMMKEVGLRHMSVDATRNFPSFELKLIPYYRASIPAEWDDARREAAFSYLEERNAGSIIKSVVSVAFDKEQHDLAYGLVDELNKMGYSPEMKNSVHHATLTSWLRVEVEACIKNQKPLPKLEVIGATVGQVVKIKAGEVDD